MILVPYTDCNIWVLHEGHWPVPAAGREDLWNHPIFRSCKTNNFHKSFYKLLNHCLLWVNSNLNYQKRSVHSWDISRWKRPFWPKTTYFELKIADINSLNCKFLRKEWINFHYSNFYLLIKGIGLTICKKIYENCWSYMT